MRAGPDDSADPAPSKMSGGERPDPEEGHGERPTRHAAGLALRRMDGETAARLVAALRRGDRAERAAWARELADTLGEEAASPLIEALEDDRRPARRRAARTILGELRSMHRVKVRRHRAVAAGVALAGAALIAGLVFAGELGDGPGTSERPALPPELPRGGRSLFPEYRVVAFYGGPQSEELGVLGKGSLLGAAERLQRQARPYATPRRPALPALELIATIAAGAPNEKNRYSYRQARSVIREHLRVARRTRSLLILDIQPGRQDFMSEVRHLETFLKEPDVGLALDSEWGVKRNQIPGEVFGSISAAEVNEVSAYLSRIVRRRDLPEKLLMVHAFTEEMIRGRARLRPTPGVALTLNVDGFGDSASKVARYEDLTRLTPKGRGIHHGIKLFYQEDLGLLRPGQVLDLRPRPELVVYE